MPDQYFLCESLQYVGASFEDMFLCSDDGMTRSTRIADSSGLTPHTMAINFIVKGKMVVQYLYYLKKNNTSKHIQ